MQILKTIPDLRAWSRTTRQPGGSVGLVPTMGALHAGHLSLVRAAKSTCTAVAASIFVNPTQFGPSEDFALYPRTFQADCELLQSEGVDVLFAPPPEEIYPPGSSTFVEVASLSNQLDGASRPGHFRGVATVVAKLLTAAEPDRAYFGQKDAAQVAVLRRMVQDLALPVQLVICPIVREPDGLAMSSRNRYLSPAERKQALVLSRALAAVAQKAASGERSSIALIEIAQSLISNQPGVEIDYITLVDWATLQPITTAPPGSLFAVAAKLGKTRLIDNIVL